MLQSIKHFYGKAGQFVSCHFGALRFETIATRLEAITRRLEAIARFLLLLGWQVGRRVQGLFASWATLSDDLLSGFVRRRTKAVSRQVAVSWFRPLRAQNVGVFWRIDFPQIDYAKVAKVPTVVVSNPFGLWLCGFLD